MRRRRGRRSGPQRSFSRHPAPFNSSRHRHSHRGRYRGGSASASGFGFGSSHSHSHSRSGRSRSSRSSGFRGNSFLPPQRAFTSSFRPSATPDSARPSLVPPVPVPVPIPIPSVPNLSSSSPDEPAPAPAAPEGVPSAPPNPYLAHRRHHPHRPRRPRAPPSYLSSVLSKSEVRSSGVGKKWVELRRERYPSLRDDEIQERRFSRNEMFLGLRLGKRERNRNLRHESESESEDEIDVMRSHLWEKSRVESSFFRGGSGRGRGMRGRGRVQIRRRRRRRFGATQRVRISLSRKPKKPKLKEKLKKNEEEEESSSGDESDDVLEYGEEEVDFEGMRNAARLRAVKKRQRLYSPNANVNRNGGRRRGVANTNTTLLGRLLEKDVEKEELAVLQCFRHFIVNGFFVDEKEELDDDIRRRLKERGVL